MTAAATTTLLLRPAPPKYKYPAITTFTLLYYCHLYHFNFPACCCSGYPDGTLSSFFSSRFRPCRRGPSRTGTFRSQVLKMFSAFELETSTAGPGFTSCRSRMLSRRIGGAIPQIMPAHELPQPKGLQRQALLRPGRRNSEGFGFVKAAE